MPDRPRRRLSQAERREQLLDAAVELAAGRDLTALSVQDIAEHAGVSEGLLYHYFPTKDALLVAAVQRAADAMLAALDGVVRGSSAQTLAEGLAAFLDHVQADPTGWHAVLQARTGRLAEIGAAVEEHARRLTLTGLGVEQASPLLQVALDGWAALEREACLTWLRHPELPRAAVEDLLTTSFFAALESAARHDEQARDVLERLSSPG
jgi:AcrR family transcriptional regulator